MITELYIASGCIASNPSMIGGTYAWRLVRDDGELIGRAAVVPASSIGGEVTNNQAEMLALLEGLSHLPAHFHGTVCSQGQVTLGRAFAGFRWTNIPGWMHKRYQEQRSRLGMWHQIKPQLVDGKNEHILWCEQECKTAADDFMAQIGANIPMFTRVVDL
jgi:hypothetical protein